MMSSSNQRPAKRGFRSGLRCAMPPLSQNSLRYLHQNPLFVIQNLVNDFHPRFPAIVDAVADEAVPELELVILPFNHEATPNVKCFTDRWTEHRVSKYLGSRDCHGAEGFGGARAARSIVLFRNIDLNSIARIAS